MKAILFSCNLSILGLLMSQNSMGQCLGTIQGLVEIEVNSCETISPKEYFTKEGSTPYGFYEHFDTQTVVEALKSHNGSMILGKVVGSKAVDTSLNDNSALLGQVIEVFVAKAHASCSETFRDKQRIIGNIQSSCCNGSIMAPCLLPTMYALKPLKKELVDSIKSKADNQTPSRVNPTVLQARKWFKDQQCSIALSLTHPLAQV